MRIANTTVVRRYTHTLNQNYSKLNQLSNQILTGRRFTKMSEDTASGVRAMQVRRNLLKIEGYIDNCKTASSQYTAAETSLLEVNDIVTNISDRWINIMNGTNREDEYEVVTAELSRLQEEMLSLMNGQFSDRYMFGGTNVFSAPFTVDQNGVLYYNGVDVSTMDKSHALFGDISYLDIGLGVSFSDENNPQQVDKTTAMRNSFMGAEIFGHGSDNIYLIVSDMLSQLRAGTLNPERAGETLTRFQQAARGINIEITKIGADYAYLEFQIDRLESETLNLTIRQDTIEAVDPEEAIMNLKLQEYVYNAALQIGQRLLQPTLFSFIS